MTQLQVKFLLTLAAIVGLSTILLFILLIIATELAYPSSTQRANWKQAAKPTAIRRIACLLFALVGLAVTCRSELEIVRRITHLNLSSIAQLHLLVTLGSAVIGAYLGGLLRVFGNSVWQGAIAGAGFATVVGIWVLMVVGFSQAPIP